jgi:hypothetical protein
VSSTRVPAPVLMSRSPPSVGILRRCRSAGALLRAAPLAALAEAQAQIQSQQDDLLQAAEFGRQLLQRLSSAEEECAELRLRCERLERSVLAASSRAADADGCARVVDERMQQMTIDARTADDSRRRAEMALSASESARLQLAAETAELRRELREAQCVGRTERRRNR